MQECGAGDGKRPGVLLAVHVLGNGTGRQHFALAGFQRQFHHLQAVGEHSALPAVVVRLRSRGLLDEGGEAFQ